MKLITEYTESDVEFITEAIGDGGKKHMIEGVFAQAESKNRNGRIYPQMVMEKAVGKYVRFYFLIRLVQIHPQSCVSYRRRL